MRKHPINTSVEVLEQRAMMAGDFELSIDGTLRIDGTSAYDYVEVTIDTHGTGRTSDDEVVTRMTHSGHTDTDRRMLSEVTKLDFRGYDSGDTFWNRTGIKSYALGGDGDDLLMGGSGEDTLKGQDGEDDLYGYAGNDLLEGGEDNDLLMGLENHDTLKGGDGRDSLYGGSGNDRLEGGNDGDTDVLWGEAGFDTFLRYRNRGFWDLSASTESEDIRDYDPGAGDIIILERHCSIWAC